MTSKNASKTGSAVGIVVKPQKGATLKVMPAPNAYGKPYCVLSNQSGNLLTTPRTLRYDLCIRFEEKEKKAAVVTSHVARPDLLRP